MSSLIRRVRGTLGMGLTWAVGWALGGVAIGVTSLVTPFLPWDTFFSVFDAPLPALAVPGFVGGVLFSLVLRVSAGRKRLDAYSLRQFAAWGAAGGVLLSLVPDTLALLGLATRSPDALPLGWLTAVLLPPLTLASAASATTALLLARRARETERRTPVALEAPPHVVDDVWSSEREAQALLQEASSVTRGMQGDATFHRVDRVV